MTMAALQQAGGETTGYSQENRLLQANIPLKRSNGDSLLLESFSGMEGVSSLFSFDLVLHSLDSTLTLNDLSGPATINMVIQSGYADSGATRYINGIISRFTKLGQGRSTSSGASTVYPLTI
jgi:type VI secretion system secreted protein VgrG